MEREAVKLVRDRTPHHRERIGDQRLATNLRSAIEGEVHFDALHRGLYATDASIYQVPPLGVVFPKHLADVRAAIDVARDANVPLLPRGAGTSQCGQTVGEALVLDTSVHLTAIDSPDPDLESVWVEPGVVLDHLNQSLAHHQRWFPVDVATSSRATLGGMAGNNSSGARSIRHGIMADNVLGLEVGMADGRRLTLDRTGAHGPGAQHLVRSLDEVVHREAEELRRRVPTVLRHVAGYNLHRLLGEPRNLADLLIGSEGTLGFIERLHLQLAPKPSRVLLLACCFPTLVDALASVEHLVELDPTAVELVDGALLALAARNPEFASTVGAFAPGSPGAVLLIEFTNESARDPQEMRRRVVDAIGDGGGRGHVSVHQSPADQAAVWAVRKAGLNIVMSRPGERKPVSFIEDCGIPLNGLAEFGKRVQAIFRRHDVEGTWYAHASVGCLHVRPGLNLKDPADVTTMREIAAEVHRLVAELGGSHSGEHGDGILRSEFLRPILGERINQAFKDIKRTFDPHNLMNPGKIVDPPAMDDRALFRYKPEYKTSPLPVALDWSQRGGFSAAVEMCNNNGACRKIGDGSMCPSYRVTRREVDSTRGRANVLRLALSGQLGLGMQSEELKSAMELCVGCKACKRECPTGVDMTRMKTEVLRERRRSEGVDLGTLAMAHLPRLAPFASRMPWAANTRNLSPMLRRIGDRWLGLSASRDWPTWSSRPFRDGEVARIQRHTVSASGEPSAGIVVLWADTLNRYFQPETARAAARVLASSGFRVVAPGQVGRPLCCGRTYLSHGLVEQATQELQRTVATLSRWVQRGAVVVGLEPSCLLTLRDEAPDLIDGPDIEDLASQSFLLEELLVDRATSPPATDGPTVHLHGHCHQKALGALPPTAEALTRFSGAKVKTIESSCCGMAGSFGYRSETEAVSKAMAELTLLPAVRAADDEEVVVAPGFSCRAQILSGTGSEALHPAQVLDRWNNR